MRKKIIAANWKMNMTVAETVSYLESFRTNVEAVNGVEIVIAPPFTAIAKLSELLGGSQKISLGAQNMYFEMSGAFTGEISPAMLRELFVRFVILGHSERRAIYGETDAVINAKIKKARETNLKPIFCIGETLADAEDPVALPVITVDEPALAMTIGINTAVAPMLLMKAEKKATTPMIAAIIKVWL